MRAAAHDGDSLKTGFIGGSGLSWNEFRVVDMDVGHATGSEIQRVVALFDGLFADALKLQAPRPAALEE